MSHLTAAWAKTAQGQRGPVIAYPCADGKGKWHASNSNLTDAPLCGSTSALLDTTSGNSIHVGPTDKWAHPIVCKKCLRLSGWTPAS